MDSKIFRETILHHQQMEAEYMLFKYRCYLVMQNAVSFFFNSVLSLCANFQKIKLRVGLVNFQRYDPLLQTPSSSSRTPPTVSSKSGSVSRNSATAEDGEGLFWNIWFKNVSVVEQFKIIYETWISSF